nr:alpha-2-macroglobulin [Methylobacterium persicinum]
MAAAPVAAQPKPPAKAPVATPAAAPVQKTFSRLTLASDAVRLDAALKAEAPTPLPPAAQSRRKGEALLQAEKPVEALPPLAAAVAADPADPANWRAYARAAQSAAGETEENDDQGRARLRGRAQAAAYRAYERARTAPEAAEALALLGEVAAAQEEWRPALDAYAASLALNDDAPVRETYEALRAEHGFRILTYTVDSDAAAPRLCFTFSEVVAPKADFTPFVAVTGSASAAVTGEGSQVCVDGLKHGSRYAVVLRPGLPSSVGETLPKAADYEIYVRDRAPQARFTGRNYVLPRTGQAGLPIVSVNAPKLDLEVLRIGDRGLLPTLRSEDFLGQLSGATAKAIAAQKGVRVWKGSLDTAKAEINQESVTAFPVLRAVGKLEPGVYVMVARPSGTAPADEDGGYEQQATQWFVVSDLGLTATKGRDGVHVVLRSLGTAQPMEGAEIRLVARDNEVLATRRTDAEGHAAFEGGLGRGEGGGAPSLVVAQSGDDYGFLDLDQGAFDLTDRGVKGRPEGGGLDAYLFTERGVYRSGETVQIAALLRNARGDAVADLPLTLVVKRPDGVEYRRASVPDQGFGGRAYALPLLSGTMHGTWRITAYTDPKAPPLGEASFLVEDYVPERLDVTLTPAAASLKRGEPAGVKIAARYLYGAPGAGLGVSGSVTVQAASGNGIPGLDGFTVGLDDEAVEATTRDLSALAVTDAQGMASVSVPVPDVTAPRPLEAKVTLAVGEPGGRALSRSLTLPILPAGPVLAVRKTFADLKEGDLAGFDVVLATPDGRRLTRSGVTWTLSRVERTYQWYRADGRWSFEAGKTTKRVASGSVDLAAGAPGRIQAPVGLGAYRLDVSAPGLPQAAASLGFDVGWAGSETAQAPDLLDLTLDKAAYEAGETIHARLGPKFAGQASVMVVSDRVHEIREVSVAAGGTTVSLPVEADWGAGAYLVATAYRPLDQAARRQPGRALGLAWFSVDRDRRALAVSVAAPGKARPRQDLTLPVTVAGLAPGEEARVTVALVDVGILNLTRYAAPDPTRYFLGQRALGTEFRDVYGYLIDGMQGSAGAIRSGGDAGGAEFADAPPTEAPLALFSGVVKVGPDGKASVTFPLPAFNGTGRVMVTAWSGTRVGQAQADVTIRDPVVVSATLPRFLDIGDRSRLFVALDNVEGPAGTYTAEIVPTGPVRAEGQGQVQGQAQGREQALRSTLRLEAGGKASLTVPLTATAPGTGRIDIALSGPGLASPLSQSLSLGVAPGTGALLRRQVRSLAPGESLTLAADLLADVIPGTGRVSLSASALPGVDVAALLQALDRYPYGCSEQVVSRAMPLLSVDRLAGRDRLALEPDADGRVREAIERVLSRQDSSGDFGLWSAEGSNDLWLDAYVTDFLTRARERHFAVPQGPFALALDRLRNAVANASEVRDGGADIAYAAYVLARNGRPVMGDLRYLADSKLSEIKTSLGRAQIAAALALLGDRGRAGKAMESALSLLTSERDKGSYRADYGSRLRDGAGLIALAAEMGLSAAALAPAATIVGQERADNRPTSTQENAWMVMAAEGLAERGKGLSFTLDGAALPGPLARTYGEADLAAGDKVLVNTGGAPVQVAIGVSGNPVTPEPAESRGYTVERSLHRLDGSVIDPAAIRQNDRLVVVLKVTEAKAESARLLLVDRLPAGLEIDNPKLLDADALQGLAFAKSDVQPVHTEFRDDRFVAAYTRDPSQPAFFTVAYAVRAVSPGTYVHPGATVEDMYRPARYGRTATGSLTVGEGR